MNAIDMPFNKDGLIPDIIVNPHAIPSRMTTGQLAECLVGKAAALQSMDADATPFEDRDFTSVEDMLEKLGYERKGKEFLYNGMTGEKILVEYFFGPTFYQRLKHLVQDKIHCLSMDHEVLTENGWKFFGEINKGEKIACLENNKLVYSEANLLYYPDFKGKMYKIETQQVNLNVTTNHRMWVQFQNGEYCHELAENLVGKQVNYKNNAKWECEDYQLENVNLKDKLVDMNSLPDWVWKLSKTQCIELLESMIFGENTYYTSSKKLAGDVMRLALHCGWSGIEIETNDLHFKVKINKTNNTPTVYDAQNITKEEIYNYEGPVFCLEVPSEVFYVRRCGVPVWTGNSRSRGLRTSLTRQAPEGRSRDGGLRLGEMERDALIAHGLSKFLKEKLLDNSDAYIVHVCDICGLFAQRFERPENKNYSTEQDTYYCPSCSNPNDISKVKIPYAFKLFVQELLSLNIAPRIRCKKEVYN
jgi:hypothetical protein